METRPNAHVTSSSHALTFDGSMIFLTSRWANPLKNLPIDLQIFTNIEMYTRTLLSIEDICQSISKLSQILIWMHRFCWRQLSLPLQNRWRHRKRQFWGLKGEGDKWKLKATVNKEEGPMVESSMEKFKADITMQVSDIHPIRGQDSKYRLGNWKQRAYDWSGCHSCWDYKSKKVSF